ncbi:MlaD family protein [Mycolicibacterium neoaurum]|uniref:MlaD family protein n=1 Tax=Mycolicibacterium neoaurum TaxID=1795 RepID=UPI002672491B|nr:MlaD family protein [Mycolicibacterium neoaurum]MDO3402711.1 MlaD family protein [Mycolicibacterium neoaurum]
MNAVKLRDVISYLTFGLIIAVALYYFASLGLRVNPPEDRIKLSMDVPEVNGLVEGSNVLLRGAPVGKVTGTRTSVETATVEFYIERQFTVPADSEVRLENLSALGESYIALMPRIEGGAALQDNQHIAAESVVQPPSISELATSIVRVLNQLEPGALDRIIGESFAALPDPNVVLPNLSRASTLLNNTVNSMNGQGRELLSNFQTLLRNAEWVNPTLVSLTPRVQHFGVAWQDFFKHLPILFSRGNPETISNLNNLVARVQSLLDDRGGDLRVLGEAFQPKLNTIAGSLMNFDTGQILDNFLNQVPPGGIVTLRVRP